MSKVQVTLKSKSLLYRKDTCLILTDFDDFQYFKRPLGFEKTLVMIWVKQTNKPYGPIGRNIAVALCTRNHDCHYKKCTKNVMILTSRMNCVTIRKWEKETDSPGNVKPLTRSYMMSWLSSFTVSSVLHILH